MKLESSNFKIYLGGVYLIVLLIAVYFLFSTFDLKDLTSYEFIKDNRETILKYKDNNIFFLTIIFFIITIFLNLLLCPMLIPTLVIGFIFGKWIGTLILIFGNTIGGFLLFPSPDFSKSLLVGFILPVELFPAFVSQSLLFLSFLIATFIPTIIWKLR